MWLVGPPMCHEDQYSLKARRRITQTPTPRDADCEVDIPPFSPEL